jgi:broad specificity phosphatase PhoE
MTRRLAAFLAAAVWAFAAAPASGQIAPAPASATAASTLAGAELVTALRRGGYILYFRHTATDFSQNDSQMTGYEDCARQRNLTEAGRADARAIGGELRRLGIPIGRVLASPYCRTMETGQLVFGRTEASTAARGGPADDSGDRYAELRALFATPLPPGANLAIASHGNPYRAVVGTAYLAEGEAAVIEPLGSGAFRVVARVTRDEWARLPAR